MIEVSALEEVHLFVVEVHLMAHLLELREAEGDVPNLQEIGIVAVSPLLIEIDIILMIFHCDAIEVEALFLIDLEKREGETLQPIMTIICMISWR